MNIFKTTTLTWWQLGMLKWAVVCIGIAIGATWASVFLPYVIPLATTGLILSLFVGSIWMKNK